MLSDEQRAYQQALVTYNEVVAKAQERINAEALPFWWQTPQGIEDYYAMSMEHRKECGVRDRLGDLIKAKNRLTSWAIKQSNEDTRLHRLLAGASDYAAEIAMHIPYEGGDLVA